MLSLINWRLKITLNDGRALTGQMLAFDKHMNLVLADCEEFRRVRPKKKQGEAEAGPPQDMKRTLGLVILRGETVVSLSIEGPPPVVDEDKKNAVSLRRPVRASATDAPRQMLPGPGRGLPAGRGMGMMPPGALHSFSVFVPCSRRPSSSGGPPYAVWASRDAGAAAWVWWSASGVPPPRYAPRDAVPAAAWVRWTAARVRGSLIRHRDMDILTHRRRFQPPPQ